MRVAIPVLLTAMAFTRPLPAQGEREELIVHNAAALGPPFRDLLRTFAARNPGTVPHQENSPSLEAVRKLTDLGKVPDVLAVADYGLLPKLVLPRFASWYVVFGTNAMVLAYNEESIGAKEITADNWWQILLRPGVRTGRSDFQVDPSGYRALMALQLAERHYKQPGLTAHLVASLPQRYVRHAEADLSALIETGELDYAWTYRSLAEAHRLKYLTLPKEIDLSDPSLTDWYAQARVSIPGGPGRDSLQLKGEPILFALTIPAAAPHHDLALSFVRFLLSSEGSHILQKSGFMPLDAARFYGAPPTSLTSLRHR